MEPPAAERVLGNEDILRIILHQINAEPVAVAAKYVRARAQQDDTEWPLSTTVGVSGKTIVQGRVVVDHDRATADAFAAALAARAVCRRWAACGVRSLLHACARAGLVKELGRRIVLTAVMRRGLATDPRSPGLAWLTRCRYIGLRRPLCQLGPAGVVQWISFCHQISPAGCGPTLVLTPRASVPRWAAAVREALPAASLPGVELCAGGLSAPELADAMLMTLLPGFEQRAVLILPYELLLDGQPRGPFFRQALLGGANVAGSRTWPWSTAVFDEARTFMAVDAMRPLFEPSDGLPFGVALGDFGHPPPAIDELCRLLAFSDGPARMAPGDRAGAAPGSCLHSIVDHPLSIVSDENEPHSIDAWAVGQRFMHRTRGLVDADREGLIAAQLRELLLLDERPARPEPPDPATLAAEEAALAMAVAVDSDSTRRDVDRAWCLVSGSGLRPAAGRVA